MDEKDFEVEIDQVEEPIEYSAEETFDYSVEGGRRRKRNKSKNKSRKSNNALKEWVAFIKKVQKEEKIDSYKKAMSRAKVRADKGEKWRSMKGGDGEEELDVVEDTFVEDPNEDEEKMKGGIILGGKRRTRRRSASRARRRTARRARGRSARRARGRSARRSRGRH